MKTAYLSPMTFKLTAEVEAKLSETIENWSKQGMVDRLWKKDATVWTGADESKWLDWLDLPEKELVHARAYEAFAAEIKNEVTDVLLLGMGGSSLAPEVFSVTYGPKLGYPRLHVLDSTDPAQIAAIDHGLDLKKTLFVVSSKSGSTLEPNIFMQYFMARAKEVIGENYGSHFIAITDPGSKLEGEAKSYNFRRIFHGYPGVGGRYSVLSPFGIVPLALLGSDLTGYLTIAKEMGEACRKGMDENPGARLGALMGVSANAGRDKLTIFTSPAIYDFGAWLEQLVAESTGKIGKAIIPVDQEALGAASLYSEDRLFVYLKLEGDESKICDVGAADIEKLLAELVALGHPVVQINVCDKEHLAGEFMRFEIATAVAGSVIGINPFDQPDVEASKIETRELTTAYEKTGSLPTEAPFFEEGQIKLFSDETNAAHIKAAAADKTLVSMLKAHLDRISKGDYFALLAYLHMDHKEIEHNLYDMRMLVRNKKHVATCLGFGPRFLHSTGQAYKGGSNSGVFLQVTADDAKDLAVPNAKYTFSIVKAAQARGDFQVLIKRQRRALRVHITGNLDSGLKQLKEAFEKAIV